MTVYLVRHGRPRVDPARPADDWGLTGAGYADLVALRESGRLPANAHWFSSPEPKAVATARLLHPGPLTVRPGLEEQHRRVRWFDDEAHFRAAVALAFADLDHAALPEWESLAATRDRVVPVVRDVLRRTPHADVVLVGHGTAWTLVRAVLRDEPPDLVWWQNLGLPDVGTL